MRRIKIVSMLLLLSIGIAGCKNTKNTNKKINESGRSETTDQVSKNSAGNSKKVVIDDSVDSIKGIANQYLELYKGAVDHNLSKDLVTSENILNRLGHLGYCAVDHNNEINMVNEDQLEIFCKKVEEKKEDEAVLIVLSDDGGFSYYHFQTKDGKVEVNPSVLTWKDGEPEVDSLNKYEAYNWKFTDYGYLMFQEYHPPGYDGTSGHMAIRVKPMDEKCREYTRKYIEPIGYSYNNMFITDWTDRDFQNLDFYDLYEKLYLYTNGQEFRPENDTEGKTYEIPAKEFENVVMSYFGIDRKTLQQHTVYFPDKDTYRFRERGLYDCSMPQFPKPEVTGYTENYDGTITLTVNAVWEWNDNDHAFTHEVVVRPIYDGSWEYVSNHVISWDQGVQPIWYCNRLSDEEWQKYYEEN